MKKRLLSLLAVTAILFSVVGCTPEPIANNSENGKVQSSDLETNSTNSIKDDVIISEKENASIPGTPAVGDNEITTKPKSEDKTESKSQPKTKQESKPETGTVSDKKTTIPETSSGITKAKAMTIAFTHAKVKANEVFDLDVELDRENGKKVWEISFETKNGEYDYDIDAVTGKILKSKIDKEPVSKTKISSTKALNIALKHVNLKSSDIHDKDISLEYDNRNKRYVYEIEFESGAFEYKFLIDAVSGKIINFDKEN